MTQTDFTDNVVITGSRDIDQLKVKANAAQAQPLQTWETSAGSVQSQVTSDGRLQVGDDVGLSSPDALVEAHRAETSTAKPKRGWHSLGKVTNLVSDLVTWTMSELLLLGSAGVSGLQTAFRAKLTHNNSGSSTTAELRAGDFQSINQTGSGGTRVGQVTGVRGTGSNDVNAFVAKAVGVEATITNASGGDVTDAVGFEVVAPTNSGTIANLHGLRVPDLTAGAVNYALKTGLGMVSLGDFMEVKRPAAVPGTPATDYVRVYPKTDGKLYAKNWSGTEYDLTGSLIFPSICNARLALDGNAANFQNDQTGSTLYVVPWMGNQVSIYNGSNWMLYPVPSSLSSTGKTIPSSVNTVYDVFIFNNSGTLDLEFVAWTLPDNGSITNITNASPRVANVPSHNLVTNRLVTISGNSLAANNSIWRVGTTTATSFQLLNADGTNSAAPGSVGTGGTWQRADQKTPRVTGLEFQEGILVKAGDHSRRYLGTIRTISDPSTPGICWDNNRRRFVWNLYNPIQKYLSAFDSFNASWTDTTASWRPMRNSRVLGNNFVEVVVGWDNALIHAVYNALTLSTSAVPSVGIGLDKTDGALFTTTVNLNNPAPQASTWGVTQARYSGYPLSGYHYIHALEYGGTGIQFAGGRSSYDGQWTGLDVTGWF